MEQSLNCNFPLKLSSSQMTNKGRWGNRRWGMSAVEMGVFYERKELHVESNKRDD